MVCCYVSKDQQDWYTQVSLLAAAYRSMPHPSLGIVPNQLMLGRETRWPQDLELGRTPTEGEYDTYLDYVEELANSLE